MKNELSILARRYAQACMSVFGATLTEQEMQAFPVVADILKEHRSLLIFVSIPSSQVRSMNQIHELFRVAGCASLPCQQLIDLLVADKRMILLPQILEAWYELFLSSRGIMHFTIESAVPLNEAEREMCVDFLRKRLNQEIQYTLKVNPELIAGIKMYSNIWGFEHSIQQRLDELASKQLLMM
jgi:F-type H+-transporting ATPase subunit delta